MRKDRRGFTLIELLVVIAIIAIVSSLLLSAMAKAKGKANSTTCAANMRNWVQATHMYLSDNEDYLPLFGEDPNDVNKPFWHTKLAPYLSKRVIEGQDYRVDEAYTSQVRRCPAGRYGSVEFGHQQNYTEWNCWVGAVFSLTSKPLTAPFYYANAGPPLKANIVGKPDDAMVYTDTLTHFVYTPLEPRYQWAMDADGDGAPDSMASTTDVPFNYGRPKVHNDGCNATLLDGHVERVPFKKLWQVDGYGQATHSFWRIDD
jgi:prepilin-type N-terminal cleavage/methylation domain-containing protein/prepilin-type processing-associated H-X9-DG protein